MFRAGELLSTGPNVIGTKAEKLHSGLNVTISLPSHWEGQLPFFLVFKCLRDRSFMAPKLYLLWLHLGLTRLSQVSPPMSGGREEGEDNPKACGKE